MKAIIRQHVPRIGADYEWASVVINGHEYKRYGDFYHEKGLDRCIGFIDGFAMGHGIQEYTVEFEEFHDPECYDYEPE